MNKNLIKELLILGIGLIPLGYLLSIWTALPETIPTHWNIHGEADSFSGKTSAWRIVGLGILIPLLMKFLPKLDPKKENYAIFQDSYYKLRLLIAVFFSFLATAILSVSLSGNSELFIRLLSVGIGLLFAGIGNYLGTVKPNFFVGIRTPWTLSNENVWKKTHQLAGKLWFFGGILIVVVSFFFPPQTAFFVLIITISVVSLIPIVYSYIWFREAK